MGRSNAGGTSLVQIAKGLDSIVDLPKGHWQLGQSGLRKTKELVDEFRCSTPLKDKSFNKFYGGNSLSFGFTDLEKPLVQDGDAADVDEHLYRSMIGSLMYLTASRPDIMFAVCACARFQVSPKFSPSLSFAYTDSDYAGATQDRKSTTGGCQFLGNRLISWQCKKQTVVATSTTEAERFAALALSRAASCFYGLVSLDPKPTAQIMGLINFMDILFFTLAITSTICIMKICVDKIRSLLSKTYRD
ncbi:hypothetical protein Tco_1123417 [Tanacetum coccineum]|uniref:Uncharacterized protein n=1 Tax=Tanacetum coccineum TaxID=301880 RepID=A0ABQ5J3A0_9ASTR